MFVLAYYNNLIFEQEKNGVNNATVEKETDEEKDEHIEGISKLSNSSVDHLAMTESRATVAYVDNKKNLVIRDMKTNKVMDTKKEEHNIIYLKWIRNDTLFFATENAVDGSKEIAIHTYTLSNQAERVIKNFTQISKTSTVKKIAFSEFTNDVYILIGNENVSRVYHFDTNGNMSSVETQGKYIVDIAVTNTDNTLYMEVYENNAHAIYQLKNETYYLQKVESDSRLIDVLEDVLYLGVEDQNQNIVEMYTYENEGLKNELRLDAPTAKENLFIDSSGEIHTVSPKGIYNETKRKLTSLPTDGTPAVFGSAVVIKKSNIVYLMTK